MKRSCYLAASSILGLLAAGPAFAQATEGDAQSNVQIEDIIVTAQRVEQSAQKAAIAINVVTPAALANAGVNTATGLNAAAPALQVTRAGGATTSYFIRGVGNFTANGFSDPAVAVNYDGVYIGRTASTIGTFFDLARVEVLKGPQGTLYGRNATGGAINIIPARPVLGQRSAYITAEYGNYDAIDAEAGFNLPWGEDVAIRVAGKAADREGYNDDGTGKDNGYAIRGQIYGALGESVNVRLAADYSHTGGTGASGSYLGTLRLTPGTAATATSPANYTFVPAPAALGPRSGLFRSDAIAYHRTLTIGGAFIRPADLIYPRINVNVTNVLGELNWETGIGTFTVLPAYRYTRQKLLFNGPAFLAATNDEKDEQFSIEARLAGKRIGPVDWLAGLYFYDETVTGNNVISQYQVQAYIPFVSKTKSYAVFGRATLNLTDRLRIVAGGRFTRDKKHMDGSPTSLIQICTPPGAFCFGGPTVPYATSYAALGSVIPAALIPQGLPTLPGPANSRPFGSFGNRLFFTRTSVDRGLTKDRFTYRLAAEFDLAPSALLYGSYETGYRSGGFNLTAGHEIYEPEYVDALTLGLKSRLFDNRVQFNVELFRWKYRNQQANHFGFDANGNSSLFVENIGRSTIQGVDVDAQFRAGPNTLLRGSVQYLDSKFDSFVYNTPRLASTLPPATGCPSSQGTASGLPVYTVDCSGQRGYNAPKWSINAGFDQTLPLGDAYQFVLIADGRYRSNRVVNFEAMSLQNSGSDLVIDASLRFEPVRQNWSLTAWVRNLTNKDVVNFVNYAQTTGNVLVATYAPPRTYGIRAAFKF